MKIGLSEGFRRLREGRDQVLSIVEVSYDDKFGKMNVTFEDEYGGSKTECYRMGVPGKEQSHSNKVAQDVFSTMAKHALRDWDVEEIDPDELVGLTVMADVTTNEVEGDDGVKRKFTNIRNFRQAPDQDEGLFD